MATIFVPGTDAVPASEGSITCTPRDSLGAPSPVTPEVGTVPIYLYVPNDPGDPAAGEVRTPWYGEAPDGYEVSTTWWINIEVGTHSNAESIYETRGYWVYP
jgi:hypothetical protein